MKKFTILISLILMTFVVSSANADVSYSNQKNISNVLTQANMKNGWPGDYSLWIQTRFSKNEAEGLADQICYGAGDVGFYVITFWKQMNVSKTAASGQVLKYQCN